MAQLTYWGLEMYQHDVPSAGVATKALCSQMNAMMLRWLAGAQSETGDAQFRSINRNPYLFGSNPVNSQFRSINNRIIRSCMRARRFSDCMHVRSTAVSEIRTLDMHARARFQRSNSVMHVFTVMHDQLCMMRALFNTSFTRILLALLLATSQTIGTVAIEIVRRSKLRVSGLRVPTGGFSWS